MTVALDQLLARGAAAFNDARRRGEVARDHTGATLSRLFVGPADFSGLGLVGTEWEDCTVGGADFSGADLSNAYVHGGRLERCNFQGAQLAGATFEAVELVGCDFTGARGLDTLEQLDVRADEVKGLGHATAEPEAAATAFTPGLVAVNELLERELDTRTGDEALWVVYGDWLLSQGDLRGELVARHRSAGTIEGRAAFEAFVGEHTEAVFRECAEYVRAGGQMPELSVEWRHGFVHGATLRADNPERPVDLGELTAKLLPLPVCRFLRRLSLGVRHGATRWGEVQNDYAPVVAALAATPLRDRLRELDLGLQTELFDDAEDVVGGLLPWGDLTALWPLLPRLERLGLRGEGGELGGLELPALRHLSFECWDGESLPIELLHRAPWPRLERLELWDPTAQLDPAALLSAFAQRPLVHLALLRRPRLHDVLAALVASPLLPRLRVVDLRAGALTEDDVRLLEARREPLRHLRLDLSGCDAPGLGDRLSRLPFVALDELPEFDEEHLEAFSGVLDDEAEPEAPDEADAPPAPLADLDIPDENGDDR